MFDNDSNTSKDKISSKGNTNKTDSKVVQAEITNDSALNNKVNGSLGGNLDSFLEETGSAKAVQERKKEKSLAQELFTDAEIKTLHEIIDLANARKLTSNKKVNDKLNAQAGILNGIKQKLS